MDVWVLPSEYLLQVLEADGLMADDSSSKLERREDTIMAGYIRGLVRALDAQRPATRRFSDHRPRVV